MTLVGSVLGAVLLVATVATPAQSNTEARAASIICLQSQLGSAIENHAAAGPPGREVRIATDSWRPTPQSRAVTEGRKAGRR